MKIANKYVISFLLGGKCDCIVQNTKTKNRFRYQINANKSSKNMYFIKTDYDGSMAYVGYITCNDDKTYTYSKGAKGLLAEDDIKIKALLYVLNNAETLPDSVEVLHTGTCSRCGRKLTNPESIETGLGPECAKKVVSKLK